MHWLRQNPAELRQLRQLRLFSDTSETTTGPTAEPGGSQPQWPGGLTVGQGLTTVSAVITSLRSDPETDSRPNNGYETVLQLWSKLLSRVLPQNGNGFV
jgi:hypothetical protein